MQREAVDHTLKAYQLHLDMQLVRLSQLALEDDVDMLASVEFPRERRHTELRADGCCIEVQPCTMLALNKAPNTKNRFGCGTAVSSASW
jgi:hypothetical protein